MFTGPIIFSLCIICSIALKVSKSEIQGKKKSPPFILLVPMILQNFFN
ncbi:uncharacterized protein METZ01_LOCUS219885 [marine metagenome]|uniref:Uncharacterized protein n=1 Tax=marine metagenome TaxID=408172 RepID=A0A382FYL1_9ZZZZ